nr:hypothetical protein [Candidatus Sigynarchaeota archaeon]
TISIEHVNVFTSSIYASKSFVVSSSRSTSTKENAFVATVWNGYFMEEGKETRNTKATCTLDNPFAVMACTRRGPDLSDDTIITIDAPGCDMFSFRCSDVEEHVRIFIPDLEMLVQHEGQQISYKEASQSWMNSKQMDMQELNDEDAQLDKPRATIYDMLFKMDEQRLHQAMERFAGKERMDFVLGCDGARAKCAISRSGNIYTSNRYLVKAPGPDTKQVFWTQQYFRVGFEFSIDGVYRSSILASSIIDRGLLDGFLPVVTTQWALWYDVSVSQEAYATQLQRTVPGRQPSAIDDVVVMVCFKIKNNGGVEREVRIDLFTGEIETIDDRNRSKPVYTEVNLNPASQDNAKVLELAGNGRPPYFMHVHYGNGTIENKHNGENPLSLSWKLDPGEEQSVLLKVPLLAIKASLAISALDKLDYDKERVRVAIYWMDRLEEAASIETPEPHFNTFYKAHLTHVLVSNDREIGSSRIFGRVGSLNYGTFANEVCMITMDLDRRGMFDDARRILEIFIEYQGTAGLLGDYEDIDGLLFGANGYECGEGYNQNQGFVLWAIAEHVRMSGEVAWLKDIAPKVVKACDWITRERRARYQSMGKAGICGGADVDLITAGLLPPGGVEDVKDFWDW